MPPRPALRRPLILASVCAAMFMIAVEATIVSTAMPQIAAQLGDLHLYSWVFAGFLLSQTATTMVFGKLADLFGRKPVLLVGIAIFLAGSALCGLAWSIPALIGFRLIQGIGAGAIQPVCLTVVGDLYPGAERAKVQGYLASVWGVSSVIGPLAGGLIIQHLSWAWIFWMNLPVGVLAAAGFVAFLHERVATAQRQVDIPGAALFAAGIAALMVAVTELGNGALGPVLLPGLLFVACAVAFVLQQKRARDPIISLGLWRRRPIATANVATLLSGMSIIGLSTFLPMYVQGVMGRSALVAGFALTAMVLGWPIGATVASRVFPRFGLRRTFLFGALLLPLGAIPFLLLTPASPPLLAGGGSLVIGLGMGFLSTSAIVLIQGSVDWAERGAATASNVFSRNLGSTLGATLLGGVLNLGLAGSAVSFEQIRGMLDRPGMALAEPAVAAALDSALHWTFWGIFLIAVAALLAALKVPAAGK